MRSAAATNLASSRPATSSTGTSIAARRDHSGCWVPVPARRRLEASPSTVLRRRSASPGVGEPGEHRLGDPAVEERVDAVALDAGGERARRRRGGRRALASSSMPAVALDAAPAARRGPVERARGAGTAGRPSSSRCTSPCRRSAPSSAAPARRSAASSPSRRGRVRRRRRPRGRAARCSATGPHDRPVWVNPWTRTSRDPAPPVVVAASRSAGTFGRRRRRRRTWTNTSGSWAPGIDQRRSMTYVGTALMPFSAANASSASTSRRPSSESRKWRTSSRSSPASTASSASTSVSPTFSPRVKYADSSRSLSASWDPGGRGARRTTAGGGRAGVGPLGLVEVELQPVGGRRRGQRGR